MVTTVKARFDWGKNLWRLPKREVGETRFYRSFQSSLIVEHYCIAKMRGRGVKPPVRHYFLPRYLVSEMIFRFNSVPSQFALQKSDVKLISRSRNLLSACTLLPAKGHLPFTHRLPFFTALSLTEASEGWFCDFCKIANLYSGRRALYFVGFLKTKRKWTN